MWLHYKNLSFDISYPPQGCEGVLASALDFLGRWQQGDEVFVFQTSGSTGEPKTIELTRKQMQVSAQATINFFGLDSEHVAWLCLEPRYIAGAMMLVRAVEANMDLLISDPDAVPQLPIQKDAPTFVSFVPLQLRKTPIYSSLEVVLVGGAPLSGSLSEALVAHHHKIWETYGMTETASHVALRNLTQPHFCALPQVELGQDSRNCLTIKGAVTNHIQLITNDVVEFVDLEKKCFTLLGRADNIINSGGIKIHPEKLEKAVLSALGLQVYFTSLPCEDLGQKLVMLALKGTDIESVKSYLAANFSKYELPKLILNLDEFPMLSNNKINRMELKKIALNTQVGS